MMMRVRKLVPGVVILLAMALGVFVGAARAADDTGLSILTEQDPQDAQVHLRVVVRSGSLSDPAGLPGVAGFTARAILRGTRTRPYKDLMDAFARINGTLTVSVDRMRTTFSGSVPAANLDPYLDLIRDIFTQPAFDVLEMTALQATVQDELRARFQDPRALAGTALLKASYLGTPAATPAEGTLDGISRLTPLDAQKFFHDHYSRENVVIGISAPFSHDDVVSRVTFKLDSFPHGTLDSTKLPASTFHGRHALIVDRKGFASVPVFVATAGVSDADPDMLALDLGNAAYGTDNGYEQLIGASTEPGLFSAFLSPSPADAAKAIPQAVAHLDDYARNGLGADQFTAARDALAAGYSGRIDTAEKRMDLRVREALTGRRFLQNSDYQLALSALDVTGVNLAIGRKTTPLDAVVVAIGETAALKPVLASLPFFEAVETLDITP